MNALDRITRARAALVASQPFFGSLALYLEPAERPDVRTMATDGRHLFYCPAFVAGLSDRELEGVVAHEVMHCALAHHARLGGRDLPTFNRAADYAINPELLKAGFALPAGALVDPAYAGMAAEDIYSILARQRPQQPQGGGPGQSQPGQPSGAAGAPQPGQNGQPGGNPSPGQPAPASGQSGGQGGQPSGQASPNGQGDGADYGMGGIMPAPGPAEAAAEMDRWQVLARQAANVAKAHNAGALPGYLERMVAELNAPRVDFRELLADWIDSRVAFDYSFTRPNRRFAHAGMILPGAIVDGLSHVVFAVDTSGSITDGALQAMASEIFGAMESGKIDRVTVIMADARVRAVHHYQRGDEFDAAPVGGGGTDFRDTFRAIEREASDASAVVYLTDLYVDEFGEEPDCPVLWAVHGDPREFDRLAAAVPFGQAVPLGPI